MLAEISAVELFQRNLPTLYSKSTGYGNCCIVAEYKFNCAEEALSRYLARQYLPRIKTVLSITYVRGSYCIPPYARVPRITIDKFQIHFTAASRRRVPSVDNIYRNGASLETLADAREKCMSVRDIRSFESMYRAEKNSASAIFNGLTFLFSDLYT